MLRILVLFLVSFNLLASTIEQEYPQEIKQLKIEINETNSTLKILNNRITSSLDSNKEVVNQSRDLIKAVNESLRVKTVQNNQILDAFEKAKDMTAQEVDLSLSLEPDEYGIWMNFASALLIAIGSIAVTFLILKRTLAKETDVQLKGFELNLQEETKLSNSQISTQLAVATEQNKANHLLKMAEFRQAWINTFRDYISVYIKTVITLIDFHTVESSLFSSWDNLKRAERARDRFLLEKSVEAKQIREEEYKAEPVTNRQKLTNSVRDKLLIQASSEYQDFVENTANAKNGFERYKTELRDFKDLQSSITQQKTRIILMYGPDRTKIEDLIIERLNNIEEYLMFNSDRTFLPQGNVNKVHEYINELQHLVQIMLKIEWTKIK
ncbi:hypothetical protein FR932_04665 [Moritella marina ATCC 15381]|uniref:Uncharacterized protein n=1 Tax=Moritella marina ATCC 15381 TaxID=1202962 RepID=A0A5J6WJ60_MORMI|nr:hypothetical protein [Moritella marina]QFI37170.1 hypothetical protein FR932_04665 [Moritella marina ATCC 15381]